MEVNSALVAYEDTQLRCIPPDETVFASAPNWKILRIVSNGTRYHNR
jgi:hypothetical protein